MPPAPRAADLVGSTLGERFRILRLIASGGTGTVFEIEDKNGHRAAAKLLNNRSLLENDPSARRFIREARIGMGIESAHVLRVHEAGHDRRLGVPFIVMELLSGVDLKTLLQARGALLAPEIVRVFVQAGRGIAAAHRKGIVHRDIKPSNLFLHVGKDAGPLTTKVCDFGLAKYAALSDGDAQDVTRTGAIVGTPVYMSPEQSVNAKHLDHRTDIWSFCASLYEALSGTKLWPEPSSIGEIIVSLCTRSPPLLHNVAPWVDRRLAEIVKMGLRSDPRERWSTMDELVAALEAHTGETNELRLSDLRSARSTSTVRRIQSQASSLAANKALTLRRSGPAEPQRWLRASAQREPR